MKKKFLILNLLLVISIILFGVLKFVCITVIMSLVLVMLLANEWLVYKIYTIRNVFLPSSKIRNVDCLYIGDVIDKNELDFIEGKKIFVFLPNCSEYSAYEILKHTYCILKDGGIVVIACGKENTKTLSAFELAYINDITVKRLNLQLLKRFRYCPLFVAPIKSLRYLFHINQKIKLKECANSELVDFCALRRLKLIYYSTI